MRWMKTGIWLGLVLGIAAIGNASPFYIRAEAAGKNDGSDWTNAWTALPGTLSRGTTYYVAAGSYSGVSLSVSAPGPPSTTVRRATESDHGTEIGWKTEYDGKVSWGPISFLSSYVIFDGATGGGPGQWKSDYGFEVTVPPGTKASLLHIGGQSNITLRHVEAHFLDRDTFNAIVYGPSAPRDIDISYCYLHEVWGPPILLRNCVDLVVQYCVISRNKSTAEWHSEGVSTHGGGNFVFRYNVWEDISGTAVIVNLNLPTSNWEVYGNVFYETGTDPSSGVGHGVVASNTGGISPMNNVRVYNNTVAFITGNSSSLGRFLDGGSNNEVYNNLYYQCVQVAYAGCVHDYDLYYDTIFAGTPGANSAVATGNPFVKLGGFDFELAAPTVSGKNSLGPPYDIDMNGNRRGADGIWDRGAFEFGGDGAAAIDPPTGLRLR